MGPVDLSRPDATVGAYLLPWLIQPKTSFKRRVDSVEVISDRAMTRHLSVDVELPEDPISVGGKAMHIVPLMLLRKGALLSSFDLADRSGASLPLLTSGESAWLTWSALAEAAAAVLAPSSPSTKLICQLGQLTNGIPSEPAGQESREWVRLLSDPALGKLIADLQSSVIMYVALPHVWEGPRRSIIKLSHRASMEPHSSRRKFSELLGWRPTSFAFALSGAGDCESYHFEVCAPVGLGVRAVKVKVDRRPGAETGTGPISGGGRRVAHVELTDEPVLAQAVVTVDFQAVRRGLVNAALVVAIFTAFILSLAAAFTRSLGRATDPTSLVLIIPALISVLVTHQAGEHEMTSVFLAGVRWTVFVSGFLAFSAGAVLLLLRPLPVAALHPPLRPTWVQPALGVLAALAWLAVIVLLIAWHTAKRGTEVRTGG